MNRFFMPAEVARQTRVMVASSSYHSFRQCWPVHDVKLDMVSELLRSEQVLFLVNSAAEGAEFARDLATKRACTAEQMRRFDARVVAHSDHWVCDVGGTFVRDAQGQRHVLQFQFAGYGYSACVDEAFRAPFDHDALVAERVASELGLPCVRVPLVCEGGNLHVNGHGTVISTEIGLLDQNPTLTRAQIEALIHGALGTRHMVWLPKVLANDVHALRSPYTIGGELVTALGVNHSDEMVAWVDERTVLLPEVTDADLAEAKAADDPTAAINRQALDEAHAALVAHGLTVVRVPEPGSIIVELTPEDVTYQLLQAIAARQPSWAGAPLFAGNRPVRHLLAASYMNFLVANEVVLVPKFWKAGRSASLQDKDETFRALIERLYKRRVVQLDVDASSAGGGGMHCTSQQII